MLTLILINIVCFFLLLGGICLAVLGFMCMPDYLMWLFYNERIIVPLKYLLLIPIGIGIVAIATYVVNKYPL